MYTRNTYFYDTVCISKSRLTTLSLLQPRNSSGLPDITLCLEHISYAILSQLRTPFIINYSSSIIMCHKWDTYVSWECSYVTNLCYSSVPLGKVIISFHYFIYLSKTVSEVWMPHENDFCTRPWSQVLSSIMCPPRATHINLQVSCSSDCSVFIRVKLELSG